MTDPEHVPIEQRWLDDIAPTIVKRDGTVIEPEIRNGSLRNSRAVTTGEAVT